jgi:N-acetylated-alpha-linked acidic dipeptidase
VFPVIITILSNCSLARTLTTSYRIYIDGSVSGSRFSSQASPLLAHLVQQTALLVPHPTDSERTLWDARHDVGPFTGKDDIQEEDEIRLNGEWIKTATVEDDLGVGVLGSGSDYTVFLQRIGVS